MMSGCFFLRHCPFPRIVTSFSNVAGGKLVSYTTNHAVSPPLKMTYQHCVSLLLERGGKSALVGSVFSICDSHNS